MKPIAEFFVKCRCGSKHPIASETRDCRYCSTPTVDFHRVCAGCRNAETIEQHAERTLALIEEVATT